ncbi:MAG: four helix bundle protein [Flavobacteriales bacterium]|nr:four helix bundle protein [Flavobacteriales bacterium]MCB9204293.1 four helix bundle protein [Flavobacteriales bacterium]
MSTEKKYDLEARTLEFAKRVRKFVRNLQMDIPNREDGKQLVRSSASIGANYLEANDGLSKKDFLFRIKLSRKEAKETKYWLNLIETFGNDHQEKERSELLQEANELMLILGAILRNSK